jgi:glycosyltransferase involved in cell wall biosynthesis
VEQEREASAPADRRLPAMVVTQLGARRHYLVPATFHSRDMLEHFYTDFYATQRVQRVARLVSGLGVRAVQRLSGRRDVGLPDRLVTSYPLFSVEYRWRARMARRRGELTKVWLWAGRKFGRLIGPEAAAAGDAIYAYSSAAEELFEAAAARQRLCVLDHATAPKRFEDGLVARQAARYEGWSATPVQEDRWVDEYADRQTREARLADLIVCGSSFVRNAVDAECGMGERCVVVPLGLRSLPGDVTPKEDVHGRPLRILFVGDEAVRKGIGDLSQAIQLFDPRCCEVRVAGNVDLSAYGREQASRTMTLLGPVPRVEMANQYRWADVFVLPSVSDTFGLVILEAMSYGVPVITTPNTGGADVVTDGVNGFLVPIMAPEAIAGRLAQLDADRSLLSNMSAEALRRSRDFVLERYAERLIGEIAAAFGTHSN